MNDTKSPRTQPVKPATTPSELVRRAWFALFLFPVSLAGAFVVGEGLYALFGYDPSNGTAPLWVDVACSVPALILFAVPAVVATWYARRAASADDRRGWLPMGFAWAVVAWFVVMNLISLFVGAAPD